MNTPQLFETTQFVARPVDEVFEFFSNPKNLERITPPFLNFKIVSMSTPEIQAGTLIEYRLKVHGIPMRWQTLIESWKVNSHFVDTQLKGPYTYWHHTHTFTPQNGGTLIEDTVKFKLPFGRLGWVIAGRLVSRDVHQIFAYRKTVIEEQFR